MLFFILVFIVVLVVFVLGVGDGLVVLVYFELDYLLGTCIFLSFLVVIPHSSCFYGVSWLVHEMCLTRLMCFDVFDVLDVFDVFDAFDVFDVCDMCDAFDVF